MSKITRKQAAEAALEFNETFAGVYVTSDFQAFQDKNDAVNHARTLVDTSIESFTREVEEPEEDDQEPVIKPLNAKDLIALILTAVSIEEVNQFLGDDERATVKAAAIKRIEILKQEALDEQSAEADRARLEREQSNPGGQSENTGA